MILKITTFSEPFNELVKVTLSETQQIQDEMVGDKNIQDMDKTAKCQDVFHDGNSTIGKRYTTTRIKSRNVLSNINYVGINQEDYYNENFIFNVYLLMAKNLNAFYLDRKFANKTKYKIK